MHPLFDRLRDRLDWIDDRLDDRPRVRVFDGHSNLLGGLGLDPIFTRNPDIPTRRPTTTLWPHPLTPTPVTLRHDIPQPEIIMPGLSRRRFHSCADEDKLMYDIPKIEATKKMPPNWKSHHQKTLREQLTYRLFRVSSNSAEFSTISTLLDPLTVRSVKQIVNPTLWSQFDQKRKEMLKLKSGDFGALTDIGFSRKDVVNALQYSKDFPLQPEVASVPYNDNMTLLFHCTRDEGNIDSILTTGLDERIGSRGLLGRGIYFTDNPMKSMKYDGCGVMFICAVLLGDCLSMDKKADFDLVREPPKRDAQKRNYNDLSFDSIVGRPGGNDNEYVIYNRLQCVPFYMVEYDTPLGRHFCEHNEYIQARKDYPAFCWESNGRRHSKMPNLNRIQTNNWPFYSNYIFEKMGVFD